jgi:hypothetical protein
MTSKLVFSLLNRMVNISIQIFVTTFKKGDFCDLKYTVLLKISTNFSQKISVYFEVLLNCSILLLHYSFFTLECVTFLLCFS